MKQQRSGSHSVHNLQIHLVWSTKYRCQVLVGEVQLRCRELIRQTCNALDVQILKGVASKDHIHRSGDPATCVIAALVECERSGQTPERSQCETAPGRVPGTETAVLGWAFLGDWLWGLARGLDHR